MNLVGKATAGLLMMTLGVALWAAVDGPKAQSKSAACHHHGEVPPTAPNSHQCCAAGHDVAALPSVSIPQPGLAAGRVAGSRDSEPSSLLSVSGSVPVPTGGPPASPPLRV